MARVGGTCNRLTSGAAASLMNESPRCIVLIDGFDNGHHLTYLRLYAKTLLERGHTVIELLPNPDKVLPWFEKTCPNHLDRLFLTSYVHPSVQSPSWRLRSFFEPIMRWRYAAKAVRDALKRFDIPRVDLVHFMWLDDYIVGASRMAAFLLPWVFPFRWSGLFFHPWHLRIAGGETRCDSVAAESVLRARNCIGVAVLDHGVAATLEQNVQRPVVAFPDATDEGVALHTPTCLAQIRERAKGRKIVGLLGHLSRRKGISTFLKASRECKNDDWLFLLLGAMGESEMEALTAEDRAFLEDAIAGRVANICVVPQRIEDESEFNVVVCECDALFAAYEMFAHSSGLVTKAGVFRKPIIVSRGYYMQEVIEKYRLGVAIDQDDSRAALHALDALGDPAEFERHVGTPDYEGFMRANGLEAMGPAFDKLLECSAT